MIGNRPMQRLQACLVDVSSQPQPSRVLVPARRKRGVLHKWLRLTLAVGATSVHINRVGPRISPDEPEGSSSSWITIEGTLDRPAFKSLMCAKILVIDKPSATGDPGSAIGGNTIWQVVACLPRAQFDHLLTTVLANKLERVALGFDEVKRGHGKLRTISFDTAPVPSDIDDDLPTEESITGQPT